MPYLLTIYAYPCQHMHYRITTRLTVWVQGAMAAMDGDVQTKWLDIGFLQSRRAELHFVMTTKEQVCRGWSGTGRGRTELVGYGRYVIWGRVGWMARMVPAVRGEWQRIPHRLP